MHRMAASRDALMKALYTSGPEDYGLVERPKPVPGPDEALVKVRYAALCHTDVIIRDGAAPGVQYPFVPCHEFAGVVEACGSQVDSIQPGDRVTVHQVYGCGGCLECRAGDVMVCQGVEIGGYTRDGGFAEYCTVPARYLFKLPDHVTLAEGAMVEPLANAVSAVREAGVDSGERTVIIGPGPIGLLALQVARLSNPPVLVLVGTRDERLALGEQFGATHTINVRREGAEEALKAILGDQGAHVAIDCAGTPSALELAWRIIGWRGRIVIEGAHGADETMPIPPLSLLVRSARVIGVCGWLTSDFARAVELISSGLVDVKPLITHTFRIEEWETAFEMITERKSEAIKVMLAL
jgi:2-desacetyl-2-hydroxyethyl bacteriochlorophyllide A dehydrogenase